MSKRFTYIAFDGFEENGEFITPNRVVELLNELHEENQKCKEYNGILYANHTKTDRELVKQISELSEENEGLRIKIRKLRLEKIHQNKENEQLKAHNQYLLKLLEDNGVIVELMKGDVE